MRRFHGLTGMTVVLLISAFALTFGQDACTEVKPPSPNSPDEPMAGKLSLEKAAEFMDASALTWQRERKCSTCHTDYAYLIARPALKHIPSPVMDEARKFVENRVANWETAKPRWDTEVVASAVALAFNDAQTTGKLHPLTRKALDWMWKLQQPDGSWNWLKCNWPPMEHDDYFGATYAALGVGVAPDNYANTEVAQSGLAKLRQYFKTHTAPDLHHKAMLLWASCKLDGLMTGEEREVTVRELLALQHEDGGWSLSSLGDWKRRDGTPNNKDAPSDGYATGLVVYVLRQANGEDDPRVQRGLQWLRTHQRESGRWFTRSLNNDKYHFITHAGTGYAVMALQAK